MRQPNTDIRFRTGMTLTDIAKVVRAEVTVEDAEDYWEWVLADLDGVVIDITRTWSVPAHLTDTRIFRHDQKPLSAEMREQIVDLLTAAGASVT